MCFAGLKGSNAVHLLPEQIPGFLRGDLLSLVLSSKIMMFHRYSHYDDHCTVVVLIKCLQKHAFAMSILGGHQLARPLYSGRANPLTSHFCPEGAHMGPLRRDPPRTPEDHTPVNRKISPPLNPSSDSFWRLSKQPFPPPPVPKFQCWLRGRGWPNMGNKRKKHPPTLKSGTGGCGMYCWNMFLSYLLT